MPAALLALVLGPLLGLVVGVLAPAGASTTPSSPSPSAQRCTPPEVTAAARESRAVFTGEVVGAERVASGRAVEFVHQVRVTRVYRGRITAETVEVTTSASGECALGRLSDGTAYVFFAAAGEPQWTARNQGGTAEATDALVSRVEATLGAGRPPVAPEPEEAEFTDVATTEPTSFSRLAAPGLALMLVGVLGFLLVSLLRRRG